MTQPIRVATKALSGKIYAGRPAKDGLSFKEPSCDVTSDCLKAIIEKVGVGNAMTVNGDGKAYEITVKEI
jgi:hypothetical protein